MARLPHRPLHRPGAPRTARTPNPGLAHPCARHLNTHHPKFHIVFWQQMLSPHQSAYMRELAELGHAVTVVATQQMHPQRAALGWEVPRLGRCRIILCTDPSAVQDIILGHPRNAFHLLGDARQLWLGHCASRNCHRHGRTFLGIISEAPDSRGWKGRARWLKYSLEQLRRGHQYRFILAIGARAPLWFQSCRYPPERIFPFAYAVEEPPEPAPNAASPFPVETTRSPRVLFVGRLVHLKGLDLLMHALAAPHLHHFQLAIVGDGPQRPTLTRLAARLGVSSRITWCGQRPSSFARAAMTTADLLVLPSRHDGWGAVVNESLTVGTPVLCTNACGACEIVSADQRLGSVVPSQDVDALATALSAWTQRTPLPTAHRAWIREWSSRLSGASLARYLSDLFLCLNSGAPVPVPPWRPDPPLPSNP